MKPVDHIIALIWWITGFVALITVCYLTISVRGYLYHPGEAINRDCLIKGLMCLATAITVQAMYQFRFKPLLRAIGRWKE